MGGNKEVSPAEIKQESEGLRLKEQKERTKFYAVLGIFIVVVVAYFLWSLGSTGGLGGNPFTGYVIYSPQNQTPVCSSGYINVCCLDENRNNICDSEEARIASLNNQG